MKVMCCILRTTGAVRNLNFPREMSSNLRVNRPAVSISRPILEKCGVLLSLSRCCWKLSQQSAGRPLGQFSRTSLKCYEIHSRVEQVGTRSDIARRQHKQSSLNQNRPSSMQEMFPFRFSSSFDMYQLHENLELFIVSFFFSLFSSYIGIH